MIIIIGYPRTGTSILFKSLENAGFNGGPDLGGHKYKSEDQYFKKIIHSIMDGISETGGISERLKKHIENYFGVYCKQNNIDIVKNPWFWKVLPIWGSVCPELKEAKFIWTRRNPLETAKSYMRVAEKRRKRVNDLIGYRFTVNFILNEIKQQEEIIRAYIGFLTYKTVWLEDMLAKPERTFAEISDFVGREVSPKLIDPQQTYAMNGRIN